MSGREPEVVIAPDALERLAAAVTGSTLVVTDLNTRAAAGARLAALLEAASAASAASAPPASPTSRAYVFELRTGLHAGLEQAARVAAQLDHETIPIAVGSGVITDIVRYAAHQSGRDFISVPTAASVDGYSSSVAAMQVDGVKLTYPARAPRAIYADPGVLAAAPVAMTRAGIGDLLGKATAGVDWLAAHLLYDEPYDARIAADTQAAMRAVAAEVPALISGEPAALRGLLDGLIRSGLSIARFGSSRPASGLEHHASHFWDLLAARGLHAPALHGLQVGYATRFGMRLQRYAYGGGVPALSVPVSAEDPLGADARRWLGEPTAAILAAVDAKQAQTRTVPPCWPRDPRAWHEACARLATAMEPFTAVDRALEQARIPYAPGFLGLTRVQLEATFHHATRLRARYTTLDFLEGQRRLEQALAVALA